MHCWAYQKKEDVYIADDADKVIAEKDEQILHTAHLCADYREEISTLQQQLSEKEHELTCCNEECGGLNELLKQKDEEIKRWQAAYRTRRYSKSVGLHKIEIARLREENKKAWAILETVINQACLTDDHKTLDSWALSAYADAMYELIDRGRIKEINSFGRRVIGEWITTEALSEAGSDSVDEKTEGGKDD